MSDIASRGPSDESIVIFISGKESTLQNAISSCLKSSVEEGDNSKLVTLKGRNSRRLISLYGSSRALVLDSRGVL